MKWRNDLSRSGYSKEKQNMATIFNPSGFSVWMQTWLPIIFSGLVFVVIAVQAFIYNEQRKLMNEQRAIMDKQWTAMNETLGETRKLSGEAKTANELTRRVLKANSAAFVRFNSSMQYPDWNKGIQEIQFVNLGKGNATDFTAEVEVIRETIPDRKALSKDVIKIGGQGTTITTISPFAQNLPLRSGSPKDSELIREGREGLILKGSISYFDGFERVTDKFCHELLFLTFAGNQRGSESGWRQCEDVPRLLETAEPPQRKAESGPN